MLIIFIEVGASTNRLDSTLIASFSNYGRINVDVFAPGEEIYTAEKNNSYQIAEGTSVAAPMVTGLAALLRSHFPQLTAPQVKEIILTSGTTYDIPVIVNDNHGQPQNVPFRTLSKSGKIINVYDAFIYAKEKYGNKRK